MDFFELVRTGSPEEIVLAITKGAKVDARDAQGLTPLMHAARSNPNSESINALIQKGAKVNDRHPKFDFSWTPLGIAAAHNSNPEVIRVLIRAGADVNQRAISAHTPLEIALHENPRSEIIKVLIEAGADVNHVNDAGHAMVSDTTPLMIAAWYNPNPEVIQTIILAGARVDHENPQGWTPLKLAASENPNPEIIRMLVANIPVANRKHSIDGALVNAVCRNSNLEVIRILLEAGADASYKSAYIRVDPGVKEICGGKIKDITGGGETLLMMAAERYSYVTPRQGVTNNNHEVMKLLIQAGVNVNEKDGIGMTALMVAAYCDPNPETIKTLIDAGADINVKSDQGWTALLRAISNYNPEVAKLLIRAGAEVNIKTGLVLGERTPLTMALYGKKYEVAGMLIQAGADVNVEDYCHVTPLMIAAQNSENEEVVEALIQAGANPRVRDIKNKTAYDYAKKNSKISKTHVVKRLRDLCQ